MLEPLDVDDLDTTVDATPFPALLLSGSPRDTIPDFEEEECDAPTIQARAPRPRESFIRLRSGGDAEDAVRFLNSLYDEQLRLMVDLVCLEHAVDEAAVVGGPSVAKLRRQVADLGDVRSAMSDLLAERLPKTLLVATTPLGAYLRGVFTWCSDVAEALGSFASELSAGRRDTRELYTRLRLASQAHFEALVPDIREDVAALKVVYGSSRGQLEPFEAQLDELFWTTWWLDRALEP